MLLPFRGMTIVEQVIENVINSQVDETVVVLGCERDEIQKVIGNWPVRHCNNEVYKEGMLSSVKCGFRFLPHDFEAALVFPGDQPLVKTGDNRQDHFSLQVVRQGDSNAGLSGRKEGTLCLLAPDTGKR